MFVLAAPSLEVNSFHEPTPSPIAVLPRSRSSKSGGSGEARRARRRRARGRGDRSAPARAVSSRNLRTLERSKPSHADRSEALRLRTAPPYLSRMPRAVAAVLLSTALLSGAGEHRGLHRRRHLLRHLHGGHLLLDGRPLSGGSAATRRHRFWRPTAGADCPACLSEGLPIGATKCRYCATTLSGV
jgi:hypothetical protein